MEMKTRKCSKDHTKLTTRDVFYRNYGIWGCLECGANIREKSLLTTPKEFMPEVKEGVDVPF